MGREVRYVPENWMHPIDKIGRYIPLLNRSFTKELRKWKKGEEMWKMGLYKDPNSNKWVEIEEKEQNLTFSDAYGNKPIKKGYMPDWKKGEKTHIQMYENTSKGTPISPVMKTPEALAQWLVDKEGSAFANITTSYEWWLIVCKGGKARYYLAKTLRKTIKDSINEGKL